MLILSRKTIFKRVILASLVVITLIITLVGIISRIQSQVNAATSEGASVEITKGESIGYGHGWATSRFSITTGGQSITGYCANPSRRSLEGTFPAVKMPNSTDNNLIKLMIYVSTVSNSTNTSVMNDLFSSISDAKKRYAYSHAVIGAIYADDYYRLETADVDLVNGVITKLRNMINNDADAWVIAKNYQLYTIDRSGTAYSSDEYQDIMWIENDYKYGNIKVEKRDSETGLATPQGDASLQGITFGVYNNSGSRIYNPQTNQFYANGALVTSGTTNASGVVTFSSLPAGTYSVKETATNSTYTLTSTASQNVTISTNGETKTVTFSDEVKKGSITVHKNDKELGSCNQLGKANFSDIKFQVINNSTNPIYYDGNSIAVGGVVSEKSLNADCTAAFGHLPYGKYKVKEVGSGTGYLANSTVYDVVIPSNNSAHPHVTFENQVIRGDVKLKKINSNNNQSMANIPFRITSKTTGESHVVVTDSNGVINTATNAHSNHTNGYDSISNMDTITYQGYGTWFGKSASSDDIATVNDSLGALPYDTYEIVEISCKQNQYCYNIESEKKTFNITSNNAVVDLGNWENDCVDFSLATTATDNADGDKFVVAGSSVKIKDTINYCLKTGMQFTIKGTLMDKTTNQALTNNGQVIEQTVTVSPTTDCGTTEMTFTINTSSLAGHEIVVYEKAYHNNDLVVAHENINDVAQTINVVSLSTTATDNADGDKFVVANSGAKIKDTISYCLKAGTEFTIKGILMDKATGESLKINGATVEQTVKITPTANCGTTQMVFNVDASSLAGHEIVVFETAYQGNKKVIAHENINDVAQTVSIISLSTTATDNADGDKFVTTKNYAEIRDVINYCVKPNNKYTIKGTLMDKTTGQIITGSSQVITETIEINPTAACGQTQMVFEFNTTSLTGHEIVVFEELYYNNELIAEHKDLNDTSQTVHIIDLSTTATDNADGDKFVTANSGAKIKDVINYCLKTGTEFTIKGILMDKNTGAALKINGETVEKSIKITPTTNCGQAEMVFDLDASSLAGHKIVVFEVAYQGNEKVISHGNISDVAQTVDIISLSTTATDNADGDKFVVANSGAKIKDTINYCLKAGTEFTIKGILMDKATGEALTNDGQTVEQSIAITPTVACGEAEMVFDFDAASLAGHEIVVFETVYQGNKKVIAHEDINDVSQTVAVINFSTFAENGKEIKKEDDEESEETEDGENEEESKEDENNGEDEGEEIDTEILKKYIEAEEETKIKDTINYCLKSNTDFTIKGTLVDKETGEALEVDGEVIEESVDFATEDACSQIEMIFEIDASALAGHDVVVFEKLYYDDELIMMHEDIEDEGQTVYLIDLTTFATNTKDDTKDVTASGVVKIKDVVKYCLRANTEFTVKGILMDKETEEPLLVNGETVEQTITFVPEDTCGETEMFYEFDATGLGGIDVVIFEDVYLGNSLLIRHEDFENKYETFYLLTPPPDTGIFTKTENGSSEQNISVLAGVAVLATSMCVYGIIRINNRRKIFNR